MIQLKCEKQKNIVTFFTMYRGVKVNLLKAKVTDKNDMSRLWALAKGQLIEFVAHLYSKSA
jgi:hypothetical protein